MKKNLLVYAILITSLLLCSCSRDESSAPPLPVDVPDQVIENSTFTFSEQGVRSAVIHAELVAVYEKLDMKKAKEIHVDFFDELGNKTSVLVADSGFIQEKKQRFEARGNVVVTTEEDVTLATESLRWNPETNKIVTDDFVTITRGADVITGIGLEADQELKHFIIKKKVQAQIKEVPPEDLKDSL
jgi:LPS export ABC transporter protein LptC